MVRNWKLPEWGFGKGRFFKNSWKGKTGKGRGYRNLPSYWENYSSGPPPRPLLALLGFKGFKGLN